MSYTEPQPAIAGETWSAERINRDIVENIKALYALLSGGNTGTFQTNQVLIGSSSGAPQGLTLNKGELLVGTTGAPAALTRGRNGQILMVRGGTPQWRTPQLNFTSAEYFKWCS